MSEANGAPVRLLPQHLLDLRRSGLSDDTIRANGFRSEDDPREVARLLNWNGAARKLGAVLVIPFAGAGGFCRVKPDNPLTRKDGKAAKYETPRGASNRAYFPAGVRTAAAEPGVGLLLTEGEKKAAKATQEGFPCIGLVGVYGWQKKRPKDANGKPTGPRELIADLASTRWEGRTVYIVFDSDAVTKKEVSWAEWHLAEVLTGLGARVLVARLPPGPGGGKVGLDDYLIAHGADGLRKLLSEATPAERPKAECAGDAVDNPHRLATGFLRTSYPGIGPHRLRWYRAEWVVWDAGAYQRIPDQDVRAHVAAFVRNEFVKAHALATKAWQDKPNKKHDDKPPTVRPVTGKLVADVLLALGGIVLLPADTEAPAWIGGPKGPDPATVLPVGNGLLDLAAATAGKVNCLHPHTPGFFAWGAVPYDYDPAATEPKLWLKFLGDLWPDAPDCIATLQEWFGCTLTPDTRQQKVLMLIGPRRSGKGTIFRVHREMIGAGAVAAPTLGSLATNFGLSPLLGKSVAMVSDARIGGRTDAAVIVERLLSISGEDAITVDRKHRDPVTVRLPTRFMLASNELPRLSDSSGALAGRLIVLPLTRTFYGAEDHHLTDRLLKELPGILNWAIAGWARLQARGRFVQPKAGAGLVQEMEDLTSPVGAFVRERCVVGPGERVEVDELYAAWKSWCEQHGRKEPGTQETFGKDLRAVVHGLVKERPRTSEGRIHVYTGIRFRTPDDPDGHPGHGGHGDPPMHASGQPQPSPPVGDAMSGHRDHGDHPDPTLPTTWCGRHPGGRADPGATCRPAGPFHPTPPTGNSPDGIGSPRAITRERRNDDVYHTARCAG